MSPVSELSKRGCPTNNQVVISGSLPKFLVDNYLWPIKWSECSQSMNNQVFNKSSAVLGLIKLTYWKSYFWL